MKNIIFVVAFALPLLGTTIAAKACSTPEQFHPTYSDAVAKAVAAAQARALKGVVR
jgi:hypothetical protein